MKKILTILTFLFSMVIFAQEQTFQKVSPEEEIILNANLSTAKVMAPPANDACSSATALTIGANCTSGTTEDATVSSDPTGGCGASSVSSCGNPGSVWYSFNSGTNTSLNLNIDITDFGNCANWQFAVYGPFNSVAAGCTPTNASAVLCSVNELLQSNNQLMTGLTTNKVYLIQILQFGANGGSRDGMEFCINVTQPLGNDAPTGSTNISACGTAFTGSTANANATGCGASNNDLDCDGDVDVSFSIENDSWFKFCATNAGTWNVTLGSVTSCSLPSGNGLQFGVFTGTTSNLTLVYSSNGAGNGIGNGASPVSQTSSNFAVSAGSCVYMVVDGFAGNECSYSFTLTNVTGGCVVLPIELLYFNGNKISCGENLLTWSTATEMNNNYFDVERSVDAMHFEFLGRIQAAGNSTINNKYSFKDSKPYQGINYYRLKQVDYDGDSNSFTIISIDNNCSKDIKIIKVTNLLGQEVGDEYDGIRIVQYSDGSVVRKFSK